MSSKLLELVLEPDLNLAMTILQLRAVERVLMVEDDNEPAERLAFKFINFC